MAGRVQQLLLLPRGIRVLHGLTFVAFFNSCPRSLAIKIKRCVSVHTAPVCVCSCRVFTSLPSVCRVVIRSQEKENSDPDYIPINSRFKCVQGTDCWGEGRESPAVHPQTLNLMVFPDLSPEPQRIESFPCEAASHILWHPLVPHSSRLSFHVSMNL